MPNEIQDFDKFATDFGKVMKYIAVSEDENALKQLQSDEAFKSVDADTVRLLNVCTNSNILIREGEEKVDMCSGLKALIEEGREEGKSKKLRELVQKKVQKGYSVDEIADMLEEHVDVIAKIIKEIE
mgnify:CR=1 FL=1